MRIADLPADILPHPPGTSARAYMSMQAAARCEFVMQDYARQSGWTEQATAQYCLACERARLMESITYGEAHNPEHVRTLIRRIMRYHARANRS